MKKQKLVFLSSFVILVLILGFFTLKNPSVVDLDNYIPPIYSSPLSLLPPLVSIILALITKEVYSSLFAGIVTGALLYSQGNLVLMLNTLLYHKDGGMISKLTDNWNMGVLVFLVILGILVNLMNKSGGSTAFGNWATSHIKTKTGAQLATIVMGVLIFIDDYFNCLTVGSIMRPITDRHKISRAKLAYIIDSTAAPICIIAPISSWAAAVTSSVPPEANINGFSVFLNTIPYNFYAILTIVIMLTLVFSKFEYGPMKTHEENADHGDLFTTEDRPYSENEEAATSSSKASIADLLFPVILLIFNCVLCMVLTGGITEGKSFTEAFADADASMALVFGGTVTLLLTFFFYMIRGVMDFKTFTDSITLGFKDMVSPILILTLAWTLSGMTGLLGAKYFVHDLVESSAGGLIMFLPALIFAFSLFLAFSTGTSWGTFAILIPIVVNLFGAGAETNEMFVISISSCLAGAVCGDHCSPISDTTIMASAGARCNHLNHVFTQMPYALTSASVSFLGFIIAGVIAYTTRSSLALIALPISIIVLIIAVLVIKKVKSCSGTATP
ncbi:MAG: Na+/H+ antiporter NhaC family protein [Lachnospiraceae bacterium]|nr:Na+/H+ antiporter NhaC family protein [Lachnospiraceae bacterium]